MKIKAWNDTVKKVNATSKRRRATFNETSDGKGCSLLFGEKAVCCVFLLVIGGN
jgi:hypothetical protein